MSTGNNIVRKEQLREIQSWVLKFARSVVQATQGPKSSNTMILKANEFNNYSKDGHSVLKEVKFTDVIENALKNDLVSLTQEIANTVGDGTTSAVILASILFEKFKEIEYVGECTPYELIERFKNHSDRLKEEILKRKQEFTPDTAYHIAYIATNGNEEVAETIKDFYAKYGNDLYIDLMASPSKETYVREFEGLTLDTGYADNCFQNKDGQALAEINNPMIYAFEDPVDVPSLGDLFIGIIQKNIMNPLATQQYDKLIPTVILCPKIGYDYDAFMQELAKTFVQVTPSRRPPLLIVTNIMGTASKEIYEYIVHLSGAKFIRKFINPEVKKEAAKKGEVATITNVDSFAGKCDLVRSTIDSTVFISPEKMYKDENKSEYSDFYNGLVMNIEAEIEQAQSTSKDLNLIGNLKRKLHALKSNMIQYAIGGITVGDRDSLKHLVEDAVKSCRSAAKYGVGQAANIEGLLAAIEINDTDDIVGEIVTKAYMELVLTLYMTVYPQEKAQELVKQSIDRKEAFDLKHEEFNNTVLTSIMSDVVIFETLSKILSLIITCNQVILPEVGMNTYKYEDVE